MGWTQRTVVFILAGIVASCAHAPRSGHGDAAVDLPPVGTDAHPENAVPHAPAFTYPLEETEFALRRIGEGAAAIASSCPFGEPKPTRASEFAGTELIRRRGYSLLHSSVFKGPHWVCEAYTSQSLVSRHDRAGHDFEADPDLELARATKADYVDRTSYGFQIGHMAPAEAHSSTQQTLADTFYLSNAVPQSAPMNGGMWARIEDCARESLPNGGLAWVITGPIYTPDAGNPYTYIGDKVFVPTFLWKVVVMQDNGGRLSSWALIVPNERLPTGYRYNDYAYPIDFVEEVTHLNLLPELASSTQRSLEAKEAPYSCHD